MLNTVKHTDTISDKNTSSDQTKPDPSYEIDEINMNASHMMNQGSPMCNTVIYKYRVM